jgi:ATP-dependent protease HslVU (ClpYQ) peptidase subunit
MTTIVALHRPKQGTVIGCDTQYNCNNIKRDGESKWTLSNGWAVGVAGSYRCMRLLREHFGDMVALSAATPFSICTDIAAMMDQYNIKGVISEESGVPLYPNSIILANALGVWSVDVAMSDLHIQPGILHAAGSGEDFALAIGHHLKDEPDMAYCVKTAIQTSANFDTNTNSRIWIHHMLPPEAAPAKSARRARH